MRALLAVYTIWLREFKAFIRERSRVIGMIGQPLLYLLIVGQGIASGLHISKGTHKTYVDVDEKGTTAAAATAVIVSRMAARPSGEHFAMTVDRPFLCALRDETSGALLFVGTVYAPKSA